MKIPYNFVPCCLAFAMLFTLRTECQTTVKTPAQAAKTLYGAWQAKSRAKAKTVANDEAVEKLFSVRWRKMSFKGCTKREEGDFECRYEDIKNDLSLAMLTQINRCGYRIKTLSFSSEAI
jgi:hypothetical protein